MRRFPPPWTADRIQSGFKVVDARGQALAYVYSRDHPHAAPIANVLTEDEARRLAANIAKLPVLLGYARRDDDRLEAENCQMNVATPRTYAIAREWVQDVTAS